MSAIALVIFEDAEGWLCANLPDIATDGVAAVHPTSQFHPGGLTSYADNETATTAQRDLAAHVTALRKLCEQVGRTLFVGGIKSPFELVDPANWDVEVADAYFQLVMIGEVIYG